MAVKLIEYQITYKDGDVDHVSWRAARQIAENPPDDVASVERVIRWWEDDDSLVREEGEILYQEKKGDRE